MKLNDGSAQISKLNFRLSLFSFRLFSFRLFSFRLLGICGATLFSSLSLGAIKAFAQPSALTSPDLASPLSPELLKALAQLDGVRFNPPPLRVEDAVVIAVAMTEPMETGQACGGLSQVLLPLQGGGLTHQDFAGLHLKLPAGESSQILADSRSLNLTITGPATTAAIALTPAAEQLPGHLSLIPAEPYVLEANTTYRWTLAIPCGSSRSVNSSGWIRKVALPKDTENIADATDLQQAQFYSHYGLWYDALDIAIDLAQSGERSPLQALQGDR